MSPNYATKTFASLVKATGAPPLTLHGLRHTAATLWLRDGVSVHLVARQLGHRDISVTLNTYSHVIPGDEAALAEAMERILRA